MTAKVCKKPILDILQVENYIDFNGRKLSPT